MSVGLRQDGPTIELRDPQLPSWGVKRKSRKREATMTASHDPEPRVDALRMSEFHDMLVRAC